MNKSKKNIIKHMMNILKISALALIVAIVLLFVGIFMFHQISLRSEAKKIVDYGQKLNVFDSTMNVLIEGEGEETIVLLTGYGTASPGLDFKPLIDELKTDYRVVVVEPFGYGLSGQTDRERTSKNIVEEIYNVVNQLNIDSFIMMGHSISGIYGLDYVNTYPNDVKAFVGIDTSVPNQPLGDFSDGLTNFLQKSGIFRLLMKVSPESFIGPNVEEDIAQQLCMLTMKNMSNKTVRNEGKYLDQNFISTRGLSFPKELPLLLFVAEEDSTSVEGWVQLHEDQLKDSVNGKLVNLPGGHYLHHTHSKEMAEELKKFLD